MRKEIRRITHFDRLKDPTLDRKIMHKDWKSLKVKRATHMESDPATGDLVFIRITPDPPKR